MAKGKTPHKSSAAYRSAGKRARKCERNVKSEITRAEARIRHIQSRVDRGVMEAGAGERAIHRQKNHIAALKKRLEVGFSVDRGNYSTLLATWQEKQDKN